jgi:hypothetical protein
MAKADSDQGELFVAQILGADEEIIACQMI